MVKALPMGIVAALAITGCSGAWQRNVYETLRNREQQQCMQQGNTACPQGEGYDDYQSRRKELEQEK